MSGFSGWQETTNYWLAHAQDPFPANINGWAYSGTFSDETIEGDDYRTQVRSISSGTYTDIQYGTDTLSGAGGNDYLDGRGGADSLSGGDGNDTMTGNADSDFVHGNAGNDYVFGGDGNDTARGGQGADTVAGDNGADFVSGDAGNDLLYGGGGGDTFNFSTGFGADQVADFNRGQGDSVRVESGTYSLAQVGADTVVTLGDGSTLTLVNVAYASLDAGWIHY